MLNLRYSLSALTLALICSFAAHAQAPAGSTGQCNDGTYSTAASKAGACAGHKGVKTWFPTPTAKASPATTAPTAASATSDADAKKHVANIKWSAAKTDAKTTAPAPVPAATPTAPPTPAAAPVTSTKPTAAAATPAPAAKAAATAPAAGGGPGMVWVNTDTKVYHCPGGQFYGKTKTGQYMTESAAKAMGARADHNKPCTK